MQQTAHHAHAWLFACLLLLGACSSTPSQTQVLRSLTPGKVTTPTEIDVAIEFSYEAATPLGTLVPVIERDADIPYTLSQTEKQFSIHLSRFTRTSKLIFNRPLVFRLSATLDTEIELRFQISDKERLSVVDFTWTEHTKASQK